jgi:Fe-S-cluster containining protein
MNIAEGLKEKAVAQKKQNRKLTAKLRKVKPQKLEQTFHHLHEEVFEEIDCLQCANCCKTTSPVFTESDINRLSRNFKMKPKEFIDTYLYMDDEEDYVLHVAPCPFLLEDNTCLVYENRPKACRDYPHTNRKGIRKRLSLSLKNTEVCPAVFEIFERINAIF